LEVIEHGPGAVGVEVVGGDAVEQERGDEQGGGSVLDDGEFEGLGGVEIPEFAGRGLGTTDGVVEVAELLVAEGGRAARASVSVDVAATKALEGDGGEIGLLWHGVPPPGYL
jgi:hypothetical protein